MTWIGWIVIGGIAGWLAGSITGENRGILKNIIVGILGALLGGWLFNSFGADGFGDSGWLWSLLVATIGAVVLTWVVRFFTNKK